MAKKARSEKDLKELFNKRIGKYNEDSSRILNNIQMQNEMYLNRYETRLMKATKSKIRLPRAHGLISKMVARVLSSDPIGQYVPKTDSFDSATYELEQDFQHDCRINDYPRKLRIGVENAIKHGFQAYGLFWNFEKTQENKGKKGIKNTTQENWMLKMYKPSAVIFNPSFDPADDYYKKGKWIIVEEIVSMKELESANKAGTKLKAKGVKAPFQYKNLEVLKNKIEGKGTTGKMSADSLTRDSSVIRRNATSNDSKYDNSIDSFRIYRMYENLKWSAWAPDYDVVILDIDNPLDKKILPINIGYAKLDTDSVIGISDIEIVQDLLDLDNTLASQKADASSYFMKPMFEAVGLKPSDNVYFDSGKIVYLGQGESFKPIQLQDTTINTYQDLHNLVGEQIQSGIGFIDNAVPQDDSNALQKTATGVRDAGEDRDILINAKIKTVVETFVEPIAEIALILKQQYQKKPKTISTNNKKAIKYFSNRQKETNPQVTLNGETKPKFRMDSNGKRGYVTITPEDYQGEYYYEVDSTSLGRSQENETQDFINFFQIITNPVVLQGLQAEGKQISFYEVLERASELYNQRDFEEMISDHTEQQIQNSGGQQDPNAQVPQQQIQQPPQPDQSQQTIQIVGMLLTDLVKEGRIQPQEAQQIEQNVMQTIQQGAQPQMQQQPISQIANNGQQGI